MNIPRFETRFEARLLRALLSRDRPIRVFGCAHPSALGFLLTSLTKPEVASRPHIVICPDDASVDTLQRAIGFFNPAANTCVLPSWDVSPYSGIFPNPKIASLRAGWLFRSLNEQPGDILLASVAALHQKTLPPNFFKELIRHFKKGDDLPREVTRLFVELGYHESPRVEDVGHFSVRGGIVDFYSPALTVPIRLELFGDTIDSIRTFDPETQRSIEEIAKFDLIPAREVYYRDEAREDCVKKFNESLGGRSVDSREASVMQQDLALGKYFPGIEFLLSCFYDTPASPFEYIPHSSFLWVLDQMECLKQHDLTLRELKGAYDSTREGVIHPPLPEVFETSFLSGFEHFKSRIELHRLRIDSENESRDAEFEYTAAENTDFQNAAHSAAGASDFVAVAAKKLALYTSQGYSCFISTNTESQAQRLSFLFEKENLPIEIFARGLPAGFRLPDDLLLWLAEDDLFNKQELRRDRVKKKSITKLPSTEFSDLKSGDYIVHVQHGVGIFDGLKVMSVQGIDAEFIQITYKDNDRLYLPIYRVGQVQKFSGVPTLDKLGGSTWQKTQIKVRNHLRDIASELLRLYALRAQNQRAKYPEPDEPYRKFEALFPYDETDDQLKAIEDVLSDFQATRPMDRLICGDVGFGKTEVAMRAAYKATQAGKQVAVLVPTTILAFQHLETFHQRFKNLPLKIVGFSRFTSKTELKKQIDLLREGKVHIAIGTHRLLSKDVTFANLGLLVVDEEQKFGVAHKEKIRKLRTLVDTLTLSATPIPRTLNMSLMGIRDLSLIATAPRDRLPIRTYVCKFDAETIRRSVLSEIQRGGQIYYVHNRVQSIYTLADELRALIPEARIRVGHGQLSEIELEETMVAFFKHEVDVLLCTTIIESGMDVTRANTMIVDRADTFGLSQLYQLRGRIGRGKERAYCYLLIPKNGILDREAQERLRVMQENTMLGSGFRIAQHDLELRGAGNILGDEQSGHINAVGHELYLELLEDALRELKGEPVEDRDVEPEINLKIPALIPDAYMPDIRSRLAYYKQLSQIAGPQDIDRIEGDLRDQFGAPPEQVLNLFGVMLIRRQCKDLGVRDISSGTKSVSIAFTPQTRVDPKVMVELALRERQRYSLTPDSRLIVKLEAQSWAPIYEELERLKRLVKL